MSDDAKCELSTHESKCLVWYIGFFVVCWVLFKVVRSLWRGLYACFIADLVGATVNWKNLGKWAVVTGSTDGIGKAYAMALAAKGFDIILISRSPEKLETVSGEIEKKYPVKTKTIAVDFTCGVEIYEKIRQEMDGLDIGVLVNNVGMTYQYPENITKIPNAEKHFDDLIKANITSCIRMTVLILPHMAKKRRGVIINLSSLSAISPMPLFSVYAACKTFVNFFTRAAQEEYRKKGIIIQSVNPSFVSTKISKMRPSFAVCTPEAFVKWAMKTVGVEAGTFGHPVHKIQGYFLELLEIILPEHLVLAVYHKIMSNLRLKYFRKYGMVDSEKKLP